MKQFNKFDHDPPADQSRKSSSVSLIVHFQIIRSSTIWKS
jgi:hypothetical protein